MRRDIALETSFESYYYESETRTQKKTNPIFFYPSFFIGVVVFFPIWIWIALYQFLLSVKIIRNQRLYAKKKLNNQIYARKCEVREVTDKKVVIDYLKHNHTFGLFISLIYLKQFEKQKIIGLYNNDKLVYLSCFKPNKEYNSWFCYALCSLSDCNVVGGASKTLKHVDGTVTTLSKKGAPLYEKLGFEKAGNCSLLNIVSGETSRIGSFICWVKA